MKDLIIHYSEKNYKVPKFIRFRRRTNFKLEYNGKLYDKEIKNCDNYEVRQLSILVEGANIKNKKERLKFVYEKVCDILDEGFYGKNLCEFNDNICCCYKNSYRSCDGCCASTDGVRKCVYLKEHKCSTRCLACKLFVCPTLRKKGIKYKINDFLIMKYFYTYRQKLIAKFTIFTEENEVLKYIYKNSLIYWLLKYRIKDFV